MGPQGTGHKKSKKPSTKPQIPTATGQPELASTCLCPQEAKSFRQPLGPPWPWQEPEEMGGPGLAWTVKVHQTWCKELPLCGEAALLLAKRPI